MPPARQLSFRHFIVFEIEHILKTFLDFEATAYLFGRSITTLKLLLVLRDDEHGVFIERTLLLDSSIPQDLIQASRVVEYLAIQSQQKVGRIRQAIVLLFNFFFEITHSVFAR